MGNEHKYDDIIHLPHPVSQKRARMSMIDRGAQFSPFVALTGYDAAIRETARLTGGRIDLTEGEKMLLNEKLREILEGPEGNREAALTWFCPDERKDGGEYVTEICRIRKIDPYGRGLLLADGRMIAFGDIIAVEEP